MTLYDSLKDVLVDNGPLENLFFLRLPSEPVNRIDAAFVPVEGTEPVRAFGKKDVEGAAQHSGGVQYMQTGVRLYFRAKDQRSEENLLDTIDEAQAAFNVLAQFTGCELPGDYAEDNAIVRVAPYSPTFFLQDARGRVVSIMPLEVWHYPHRSEGTDGNL